MSSGDRLVDLIREGVDCVLRAGTPRDSSLVARPLANLPQVLCASRDHLARFGLPRHPDDLTGHQMVKFFSSTGTAGSYPLTLLVDAKWRDFTLPGWASVNDAENNVVCALQGCGLIQLPRFHVEHELSAGMLVEVLSDYPSPELPLWAMYPYRTHLSPRVRVFVEWLGKLYERRFGPVHPPRQSAPSP